MSRRVLRGGIVVGPSTSQRGDVLIDEGRIVAVGENLDAGGAEEVDCTGAWIGPAFVDLHTHLREPGGDAAETITSGARAGVVGGYSALVAMPNTDPALDSVPVVRDVLERGRASVLDVAVCAAITVGRRGERLAPLGDLAALGVHLFSDDGTGVANPQVMRRALEYARPLGVRLAQHCEDADLCEGGVMNEGEWSLRLGLGGRPVAAEEIMVARDLDLLRWTGGRLHLLHLSSARSVSLALAARAEGLDVTFEVTPHHLVLDESACADYDPVTKVHPPLRGRHDVDALGELLRDGRIDAVATDHAPHTPESKDRPFDEAPAGLLGLEHAAALTHEVLGGDRPVDLFRLLSRTPARIARLHERGLLGLSAHGGDVVAGEDANLVVFDPSETWIVDRARLQSRANNTPYHGRTLTGRVRHTLVRGELRVREGDLQ